MTEYVVRARIDADAKGLVEGVSRAEAAVESLTAEAERAGRATAGMGQSFTGAGKQTEEFGKSFGGAIPPTERFHRTLPQVGTAAALTRQQMMALNYTVNDVVASLASGISPMTILMQQGPQLSDAWGGPVELFRSLTSLLTPLRLGIIGLTGAVTTVAAATLSYEASLRQVDVAVRSHGNALGLTREGYAALATSIAAAGGVSERFARETIAGFVREGARSEAAVLDMAAAVRGFAVATGEDAADAAARLAEALGRPSRGAQALTDEFGLLDDASLQAIATMERQGDVLGAQELLAEAVRKRFADLRGEVGLLEGAFSGLGTAMSGAWDWLGAQTTAVGQSVSDFVAQSGGIISALRQGGAAPFALMQQAPGRADAAQAAADRAAAERRAEEQWLGEQNRRYDRDTQRLRELADQETRVRRAIASGIGDQAANERTLNGILEERKRLLDGQRSEADKLAEKTTQRLTDLRAEVALAERLAAVRAGGDRRAVREAEAEARAMQGGFDPATAQGRAATGLFARAGAVADHARAAEDLRRQMTALQGPLATAIADANRWRDETLGGLDAAASGYQDYVAMVEAVHGERIAKALADDLRRRTDWAAGIQRGLADLKASAADFAATAEAAVKGWSSEGQNAFIAFARTGRFEVGGLADFVVEQFAKIAYQRTLQGPLDTLGGFIFDGFNSLLNGILGGGGAASPAPRIGPPVPHIGGIMGVDAFPLRGLPRFHAGALANDETLAVIRTSEGIFTPRQMDNASALIAAIATRPIMIELPGAASPGGMPRVEVHVHGGPGAPERTEQRRTDDGGLRLDLIYDDMAGRMADDVARGRGPLGAALESTYGITRTPVRR